MTADAHLEATMPRILTEIGAGPSADYAGEILAEVALTRQRPAWSFPQRWIGFDVGASQNRYWLVRTQWAVILVVVALIAALAIVAVGSRKRVPPPFGPAINGLVTFGQNGDIYVGNPIDHTSRDIVSDPSTNDSLPFFAPDGIHVAFFRSLDHRTNGETQLVVARSDGTQLVYPRTPPLHELPWAAVWAPDSRTIALITTPRGDSAFAMVDAVGNDEPRPVDLGGISADGIAFQPPTGDRMLFRGNLGRDIGLFTARTDGSDIQAILPTYDPVYLADATWPADRTVVADLRNPVYSPDGRLVAFMRYSLDPGQSAPDVQDVGVAQGATDGRRPRIFVASSDGSSAPKMVGFTTDDLADAWPVFSPDGTKLAFLRDRGPRSRLGTEAGSWRCAVLDIASGTVIGTGPSIDGGQASLSWSPDGTQLLVFHHSLPQVVWIVDPAGGPSKLMPWSPEEPGLWQNYPLRNGLDPGSYQRLAGP